MIPARGPTLLEGSEKTRLDPQSPVRTLLVKSSMQLIFPPDPVVHGSWLLVLCSE